jgi:hypothetical protein
MDCSPGLSCCVLTWLIKANNFFPLSLTKRKDATTGKLVDGEKKKWKSDITVVKATVQFLQETGRLTYQPEEGQVG